MRKFTPRRPSAAMLVAATALVSSLAGPAAADEVARIAQSITSSKQIENGTVTGADIKNGSVSTTDLLDGAVQSADIGTGQVQTSEIGDNAIRGDKVQANTIDSSDLQDNALRGPDVLDNSLTGADLDEGSLGQVPGASRADRAGSAENADNAGNAGSLGPNRAGAVFTNARMSVGESGVIARSGPFVFRGTCEAGSGEAPDVGVRAEIEVESTVDNSFFDSGDEDFDDDFDAGETALLVSEDTTSENEEESTELVAYSGNGDWAFIDEDSEPFAVMVNTNNADCRFYLGALVAPE
jgi:hypothetical protein